MRSVHAAAPASSDSITEPPKGATKCLQIPLSDQAAARTDAWRSKIWQTDGHAAAVHVQSRAVNDQVPLIDKAVLRTVKAVIL